MTQRKITTLLLRIATYINLNYAIAFNAVVAFPHIIDAFLLELSIRRISKPV